MEADEIRSDRRYTKDHEWALEDGAVVRVGITAHAVNQLGDVTLVNIDVKPGDNITAGKAFGTVESVKAVSDLFAPISGKVESVNKALQDAPEKLNEDPYTVGWVITLMPSDKSELDTLLDADAYRALLSSEAH
jgi:glycine cleavage system H protein